MRFLLAIVDALVGFVQRNPLTVLIILILALGAPALLKGIAMFFLYLILGFIVLAVALLLLFRWRIYQVKKQMGDQFGAGGFGAGSPFSGEASRSQTSEGEVKVYRTTDTPDKRVAKDVGDYVEFEETKEK